MQTERDQYADLEKPLEDVRNEAAIVSMVMQPYAYGKDGVVKFSDDTWATLLYGIGHLKELIDKLHQQYHRDDEAVDTLPIQRG
jgi:hypothetical protein